MKTMKRLLVLALVVAMCIGTVLPARALDTANAGAFVDQLYNGLLERPADDAGKAHFVSMMLNDGTKGTAVAEAICASPEFRARELNNTQYVTALYRGLLGREPDAGGLATHVAAMENGKSRNWVFQQIAGSVEYAGICVKFNLLPGDVKGGSSMEQTSVFSGKAADFVKNLYDYLLGRTSTEAERKPWVEKITSRQMTAAGVASAIISSQEFSNKALSNADYVQALYMALLNRPVDTSGWTTYMGALNSGKSRAWVFANICASVEFTQNIAKPMNADAGTVKPENVPALNAVNATACGTFVTRCYVQFLDRSPSDAEKASWVNQLVNRKLSAAGVAAAIASSEEAVRKDRTREQFVTKCYLALLGRDPDAGGKKTFVDALVSGYSRAWVFTKICGSVEFQNRDEFKTMQVVPGYLNAAAYKMG